MNSTIDSTLYVDLYHYLFGTRRGARISLINRNPVLSEEFLMEHQFKEWIKQGLRKIPSWTKLTLPKGRYMPHQSTAECARRLRQLGTT